jgi:predicted nucleic acid-binding protein
MIVVDSSALIEYYRPKGDPHVRAAVAEAIASDEVAVNGIIRVEILGFAPSEVERRRLASDFEAFHSLRLGDADFDLACRLGFDTRRRGHTVPATDLIIAASALRTGAPLLHVDAHFDRIAEVSDLVVVERRTES